MPRQHHIGASLETWQKIAIAGAGVLAFLLLPIWRSGDNRGQNLIQFIHHHSVFSKSDAMWIKEEELKKLREMPHGS